MAIDATRMSDLALELANPMAWVGNPIKLRQWQMEDSASVTEAVTYLRATSGDQSYYADCEAAAVLMLDIIGAQGNARRLALLGNYSTAISQLAPKAGAASYEAAWSAAVVANGGAAPTNARKGFIQNLIAAYVACGWWDAMDDTALLVAETAQAALTTLKRKVLMTATAAPTFTANGGYAFNGTTQFIDTGWIAGTHAVAMTTNTSRLGAYELTNVLANTNTMGSASNGQLFLRPRGAPNVSCRLACAAAVLPDAVASSIGYTVVGRAGGSLTVQTWKNGVAGTTVLATTPGGLPVVSVFIGAANNGSGAVTGPRACSVAAVDWGALVPASEPAIYTALRAYLTACGVP